MRQLGLFSLILCLAAASGCNLCCWGKRNAELTGPTDIRKSQQWCLGEDAVFHQPMGPSRGNYGMKQTSWREWQSDALACANSSCGPTLTPAQPLHQPQATPQLAPPQQNGVEHSGNPFRDDAIEPLPSPTSRSGAKKPTSPRVRMAATSNSTEFQTLFTAPPQASPKATAGSVAAARSKPQLPKLPPRVVSVPAPANGATPLAQQSGLRAAPSDTGRLHITVSDAIDLPPARTLAPIAAPGAVLPASLPSLEEQIQTKETVASLERMIEPAPSINPTSATGPAVIRNEFAAPTKPFRLSTRTSRPESKRDPELEQQTLSALGDMFSDNAPASSNE